MSDIALRPITAEDRPWAASFLIERWGSDRMVAHGDVYYPAQLDGFLATNHGQPVGYATYQIVNSICEIVFIDSGLPQQGIGTALLAAIEEVARHTGCTRLWLVTTNDNLGALRFYQRRDFRLAALRPGALEAARRLKPEIPLVGEFGIPLRDELELEKPLVGVEP